MAYNRCVRVYISLVIYYILSEIKVAGGFSNACDYI